MGSHLVLRYEAISLSRDDKAEDMVGTYSSASCTCCEGVSDGASAGAARFVGALFPEARSRIHGVVGLDRSGRGLG